MVTSPPLGSQPALSSSLLTLGGILAALWPAFAAYGWWRGAWWGVAASAVALVICTGAAGMSLLLAAMAHRARQPITGVLSGMALRMAVPLVALLAVPRLDPVWAASGVQVMLLAYYLAALAVETWLLVRLVPATAATACKAS